MDKFDAQLPQLDYVPRVFVSAVTGQRVTQILATALEVYREYCTHIPTPALNELLLELRNAHPPPRVKGVRPALKYITQVETKPPTFLIFGRNINRVGQPYESYLSTIFGANSDSTVHRYVSFTVGRNPQKEAHFVRI